MEEEEDWRRRRGEEAHPDAEERGPAGGEVLGGEAHEGGGAVGAHLGGGGEEGGRRGARGHNRERGKLKPPDQARLAYRF